MSLRTVGAGLIENNIVSMARVNPLYHWYSGAMKYFNNLTAEGESLRGFEFTTQQKAPELAAEIEEIILLSLIK